MKYIQYKDTKAMRGSKLFELLESGSKEDMVKAEALYREIDSAFKKNFDVKTYGHLLNWKIDND